MILGLREFEPDVGTHGEVWEIERRHGAVVLDLSAPGRITLAAGLSLEEVWPSYRDDIPPPLRFLLYADRAIVTTNGQTSGAPLDRDVPVVRVGDSYVTAYGGRLGGPLFPTELGPFAPTEHGTSTPPLLSASPNERFVAGLYVEPTTLAPFVVELAPEPRIARPASWIALSGRPLLRATMAVSDDGTQIVYAASDTETLLASFAPDGTRTDLAPPAETITQIVPIDAGQWLVQAGDAVMRVDSGWREIDRSDARPQRADSRRWVLPLDEHLVWLELASTLTTPAVGADRQMSVELCATWLTPALDVSAATCTTLSEGVLGQSLPPFPLQAL